MTVASDLSLDEQRYLYRKTRQLKERYLSGQDIGDFRIRDADLGIYLIFLENSTRTKESFRNAAAFHRTKLNLFDTASSSFAKSESIIDTVKMLFGYSRRSVFIMRTRMEGVCRALDEELGEYADRLGWERPVFINGGDGRHEHPTQEYLDEFTFLEFTGWDDSYLHLALIGDLFHGRTIHSKVDGLKAFRSVKVDLVAPEDLAIPASCKRRMEDNGFELREWESIDEYLASGDVAPAWYLSRLQLERMGDEIRDREHDLRQAVTFRREFLDRIPEGTKFFHPLPRHREKPVIPAFLDLTPLNGWDGQSINGYYTRIVELAMVAGHLGEDFEGQGPPGPAGKRPFIIEAALGPQSPVKDRFKVGIKPVDEGIVIDHIARNKPLPEIWDRIDKIRRILNLNVRGSHGVFHTDNPDTFKGIISLPDVLEIKTTDLKKLAAVSPDCTLNVIRERMVHRKYRLSMPPKIYKFDEISCKNPDCVTHPEAYQHVPPYFYRSGGASFECRYCGREHAYQNIWDI